jgi:iron complex transport system substrate-binding protein
MHSNYIPRRVVSLQPSATVTLERIGLLNRVVACTKWCADACPQVAERAHAIVADSWTAKSAEILAANPDLVIASVPYQAEAVGEILKAGIMFLGLAPHSLHDIYTDIAAIARIMGEEERGEKVIAEMQAEIKRVRHTAGDGCGTQVSRPIVFCEEWGKPIIHSQPWVAELVEAAGGEFLGKAGSKTDAEAVNAGHPDVMVMAWCGAGDRVPLEKIVEQRGWQNLPAARERRVFCIPDEFLNTPAPTLLQGLHALAGIVHPELFPAHPRVRRIEAITGDHTMKEVVAALIVERGAAGKAAAARLLICQRTKHQSLPLKWEFPGGKIEPGEQPPEALRRELEEELGIQATIGQQVARVRHTYQNGNVVDLRFYLVREYEGALVNRIFRDIRWVELKELPSYDFLDADVELVGDLASGKLVID